MTGPITTGLTGSTATKFSPGTGSTQVWDQFAATPSATRKGGNGRTAKTNEAAGRPASTTDVKRGTQASTAQIKAFAVTFVNDCWKDYAKKYPEAFHSGTGSPNTKAPKVVFLNTDAEFARAFGGTSSGELIAFVKSNDPTLIYVHTANLSKYTGRYGLDFVKSVISHELVHSLTGDVALRMQNDTQAKAKSQTYVGVMDDLSSSFDFDSIRAKGELSQFSVRELISESAAERYSAKATGLKYFSVGYALIRSTGEKLVRIVGEEVFRKAVLANDPVAYEKVVKAAKNLQVQNEKEATVANRAERVNKMLATQAATPFGTPISAKTLDRLSDRYFAESNVQETLDQYSPAEKKNFNFRFSNAIGAYFKSQGVKFDRYSGDFKELEGNGRKLSAAIIAVWPTIK